MLQVNLKFKLVPEKKEFYPNAVWFCKNCHERTPHDDRDTYPSYIFNGIRCKVCGSINYIIENFGV